MSAWRCSLCDVNWPFGSNYRKCPVCRGDTWEATGTQALNYTEAEKLAKEMLQEIEDYKKHQRKRSKAHAEFEKWYEEREVEKFRSQLDSAKLC